MNKLILSLIPVLCMLGSCGSQKVVATKYYLIEIPMDSVLLSGENRNVIIDKYCEILPVDVNPAYSSTQIANRGTSNALTYYSHHHWAIRPSETFSRLMLEYFRHTPLFLDVSDRFWRVQPDYNLETTIYHLEVIQEDKKFYAHLNLEFRLIDTNNNKTVVQHLADQSRDLEERDLDEFASKIGEMFYEELKILNGKITENLNTAN